MDEIKNNVYYRLGRCELELERSKAELAKSKDFISLIASEIEDAFRSMDKWDVSSYIECNVLPRLKEYE